MDKLIKEIEKLKKSGLKKIIDSRIKEFEIAGKKDCKEIFKEMCFCLMTANFQAEKSWLIQKKIDNGFCSFSQAKLAKALKDLGHRFPNTRANFISEAQKQSGTIKKTINSFENEYELREWLVKNIKGYGYKEASHFLRNIGYKNLAILDRHIINLMREHNIIKEVPKTLTKNKYLEIEKELNKVAEKTDLSMAELDFYMWYQKTGKILK